MSNLTSLEIDRLKFPDNVITLILGCGNTGVVVIRSAITSRKMQWHLTCFLNNSVAKPKSVVKIMATNIGGLLSYLLKPRYFEIQYYLFVIPYGWDMSIGIFGGPSTVVAFHENCISKQRQIVFLNNEARYTSEHKIYTNVLINAITIGWSLFLSASRLYHAPHTYTNLSIIV